MAFLSPFLFPDNMFIEKRKMTLRKDDRKWIEGYFKDAAQFDAPMAQYTSLRVGGPAEALIYPHNIAALCELLRFCSRRQIPYYIIGGGTNLLVKDKGIKGIVVSLKAFPNEISIKGEHKNSLIVEATAGVKTASLCQFAVENGLQGLNFAIGIPGTVGGAIVMNAGTTGGTVADVIDSLQVLHPDGTMKTYPKNELCFSYRALFFNYPEQASGKGVVILSGIFLLEPSGRQELQIEAEKILKTRKRSQPSGWAGAGCFFKNPAGEKSAGELIERAGLKGKYVGNAQISTKHANFLINTGGATAGDIIALMNEVKETVSRMFGVDLKPEVKIIGT